MLKCATISKSILLKLKKKKKFIRKIKLFSICPIVYIAFTVQTVAI